MIICKELFQLQQLPVVNVNNWNIISFVIVIVVIVAIVVAVVVCINKNKEK